MVRGRYSRNKEKSIKNERGNPSHAVSRHLHVDRFWPMRPVKSTFSAAYRAACCTVPTGTLRLRGGVSRLIRLGAGMTRYCMLQETKTTTEKHRRKHLSPLATWKGPLPFGPAPARNTSFKTDGHLPAEAYDFVFVLVFRRICGNCGGLGSASGRL